MRKTIASGLGVALALLLVSTIADAQYDGPPYAPDGPGPYAPGPYASGPYAPGPDGYGPPPGRGGPDVYGYPGPRRRAHAAKPRAYVAYQGYRIGLTAPASSEEGAQEAASVEHQVDIVNHAGLSARDVQFFRGKLITSSNGAGAGRSHGGRDVSLGRINYDDSRPVLLHEFMHVYHRNRLPGGFKNPTILRFYHEAVASGLYPQGSYMLKDQREFFAMTASAYLNGSVARPPYNRDTIREAQPAYYAYLGQLFGPR